MNGRLLTRRALPTLVAALSLGAVGTASASTAEVTPDGKLVIKGTAGENNIITFERAAPLPTDTRPDGVIAEAYIVRDFNGTKPPVDYPPNFPTPPAAVPIKLIPLTGCTPVSASEVRCTATSTQDGKFKSIDADLNDGFDYLSPTDERDSMVAPITAKGGATSDFLKGGAAADTLNGGVGDDTLQGYGANDVLQPETGANQLYGSSRDLDLVETGGDHDVVDYSVPAVPAGGNGAYASIDPRSTSEGTADDGFACFREPGEPAGTACDNIDSDIEDVKGSNGRDIILTQSDGTANVVNAGEGNDLVSTFGGNDTINGAAGNDALRGGDAIDTIDAGDGNDTVFGGAGNDDLTGGAGNDDISGGDGDESKITAGDGDDLVRGGAGADTDMNGGNGSDTLSYDDKTDPVFASLNETNASYGTFCSRTGTTPQCERDSIIKDSFENLQGGSAGDILIGSDIAVNRIEGNGGNDQLEGLDKDDALFGGDADDTLLGGKGADDLHGGKGEGDFVSYEDRSGNVRVTLDGQRNDGENCPSTCENDNLRPDIENLRGGKGSDFLEGADPNNDQSISGNNTLEGYGGSDTLNGKLGSDVLQGDGGLTENGHTPGTDTALYTGRAESLRITLDGQPDDGSSTDVQTAAASTEKDNVKADVENVDSGNGSDFLRGSASGNSLTGNEGNDTILGEDGPDALTGNSGNDTIVGGTADDSLTGDAGNDDLEGGADNDTLSAGAGEDILDGSMGSDKMNGGDGTDVVEYTGRLGTSFVKADLDGAPNDDGQAALSGQSEERDTIAADVENLTGGAEVNHFEGSFQPNVLKGGDNNDRLSGGAQNDHLLGEAGNDSLFGDSEDDLLDGGAGADDTHGGGGFDTADYRSRTAAVSVTFDELANDGEAGEGDNIRRSVEDFVLAGDEPTSQPQPAPAPAPQPAPVNTPVDDSSSNDSSNTGSSTGGSSTNSGTSGSSTSTTTVNPTTEQRSEAGSTDKQESAIQGLKAKSKTRKVIVRGRILVKARDGLAMSSSACKRGGKVVVTLKKGRKVVGKRVVKLNRSCSFRAPVKLASGTAGKVRVIVRFRGNRMLEATKRTTKLQVNG